MIVHALAFLLAVLAFSTDFLIDEMYGSKKNIGVLIETALFFASYICLFFVLWHLGAKQSNVEELTNLVLRESEKDSSQGLIRFSDPAQ